jgi:phage baseplate assembly protein W
VDREQRNKEFLGQGLSFPLQVNARGEIGLARGEVDIEQAIRIILETAPGERVMRPEFGCRIHELIFAPRDPATEGLMIHYIQQALLQWEPRIEVQEVQLETGAAYDAAVHITVHYRVKSTHDERSLIYPLYLMGEEE